MGGSSASVVGQQLAVPDVGQPVAAVEGPGVRRLAAVAVADHLGAAAVGRRRRVAADRQRPAPVGQPEVRRAPRECAPSAPTTTGARNRPSSTTPSSVPGRSADPVPDAARRPPATARSTSRASKTSRGITQTGRAIGRATDDGAARELEPGQRRPAVLDAASPRSRPSRVEDVRRDPVAAGLVAREVGAVEQQHPQAAGRRAARRARSPRRPARRRRRRGPSR